MRQDRILDRAEQRRLGPHAEQHHEQQRQVAQQHAQRTGQHDEDLGELDPADQRGLLEALAQLSAQSGKEKERQDEQQRAEVDQQTLVGGRAELEQNRQDQRLLEHVVVERAEQLSAEERQKAALAEQTELRAWRLLAPGRRRSRGALG